jgi:hypothetical protein
VTEDLATLLRHQHGVISIDQALRHLSHKTVRHRLASGRWRRPHRSIVVTHTGPLGPAEWRWAAVLAAGDDAVLGGLTAAEAAGLIGYRAAAVHVLLPAHRRARSVPPGVIVHRSRVLDERDVLGAASPPRTRAARSVVDAAQWARTDTEARALIAACFQQRLVRGDDVSGVLARLARARRHQLITTTVADAAGGSHSLAELDFLGLCRSGGLPTPSRQVVRRDGTGRRRYLDAYFPEWRIIVEIDGGQHLDPGQAWADMRRQNDLWTAGERVLRFPSWALRTDPTAVVAQLRAALRSAGWPG